LAILDTMAERDKAEAIQRELGLDAGAHRARRRGGAK
jgi:hypothetical protein